jgi:hypothetical protein
MFLGDADPHAVSFDRFGGEFYFIGVGLFVSMVVFRLCRYDRSHRHKWYKSRENPQIFWVHLVLRDNERNQAVKNQYFARRAKKPTVNFRGIQQRGEIEQQNDRAQKEAGRLSFSRISEGE